MKIKLLGDSLYIAEYQTLPADVKEFIHSKLEGSPIDARITVRGSLMLVPSSKIKDKQERQAKIYRLLSALSWEYKIELI